MLQRNRPEWHTMHDAVYALQDRVFPLQESQAHINLLPLQDAVASPRMYDSKTCTRHRNIARFKTA